LRFSGYAVEVKGKVSAVTMPKVTAMDRWELRQKTEE